MEQNNNNPMNNNPAAGDKTFSQDDVNRIVGERLAKEKAKSDAALAEREQQLAMRELRMTAKEKLSQMGLPVDLMDALNLSSQEALDKSLELVEKAVKNNTNGKNLKVLENPLPRHNDVTVDDTDRKIRKAMGLPD